MLYFIQIYNMLKEPNRRLLIGLFDDIVEEGQELGYEGLIELQELVNDNLLGHFGLELTDSSQLELFTKYLMKHQGELEQQVSVFKSLGAIR